MAKGARMKKIIFFFIFLFSINNCFAEEQFVNPVFNKTLYAYSRGSWDTLLTPTTLIETPDNFSDDNPYMNKHSCELLENEFDHIKYKCNLCYKFFFEEKEPNCSEKIVLFKILDDGKIQKLCFNPGKTHYYSREHFVVDP